MGDPVLEYNRFDLNSHIGLVIYADGVFLMFISRVIINRTEAHKNTILLYCELFFIVSHN
jgi:hypothetical protein